MDRISYQFYEFMHLALAPARAITDALLHSIKNPLNPLNHTTFGRNIAASAELFERMTRRYGKPLFGLDTTIIEGEAVPVVEEILWRRPFCGLLHFKRQFKKSPPKQSKLLIVAPMSGHYATLLRGTVEEALAPSAAEANIVIGHFIEKSKGNRFEYRKSQNDWGKKHGYPHEVWVSSSKTRSANVKGTVCYIVTDEDGEGKPVVDKWMIKSHFKYVKAD